MSDRQARIERAEDVLEAAGEDVEAAILADDFDAAARAAVRQNYALVELMADPEHRQWLLRAGPVAIHYSREVIAAGGEGNETPESLMAWSASVDQLAAALAQAQGEQS